MHASIGATQTLALAGAALFLLSGCSNSSDGGPPAVMADSIYINGKVVTVDDQSTIAQAFAVKDGKYIAVGSTEAINRNAGPGTVVVDLRGRTIIPGLADSHLHSAGGGPGIDLSKTRTLPELFAKVSEAAAKAKPGDLIVSNGDWHEAQLSEQRLPLAAELEVAAPGIAVVLVRGGHSYFLNTTALARYNISAATPVPAGGAIPRDADGKLTGELVDTARRLAVLPPAPATTIADLEAQQKVLNSYGLTSVRIPGTTVANYRQFQEMRDAKKATLRYSILFRGTPVSLETAGVKPTDGDEWVKVWGIKISVDGGFEGGFMTRAYEGPLGAGGTYFGLQTISQAAFNDSLLTLNRAGWRAAVHAVGDAAVDQVLEGMELANRDKDITKNGWTIEHAFVTRPDQYPRMKNLNLRLSVQDHLYLVAPVLKGYWGIDRASQVTPMKSYLDQGFLLAGGTDAAVIPVNPFWVMYHFLTRDTVTGGVYGANQAITSRDTVLRIMTINNAKLTDEQAIKGSIENGKLADFVALSADYLTIPENQVEDLKAVATFVGGVKVYQDPNVPL